MTAGLGRKQIADQRAWLDALGTVQRRVSRMRVDMLAQRTAETIKTRVAGRAAAFAWSGGKDSLVLERVCYMAGIRECVLGLCDLEYPAFLRWATDHMPEELQIVNTGQNLEWLAANPHTLFPQGAREAGAWFKRVQHTAQRLYFKEHDLGVLLLGRRRIDGNHVGPKGRDEYTDRAGVTRYSPLADWTHDEILGFLSYRHITLPPNYYWRKGFRVGTGPWAARQYTGSTREGWREVFEIDPSIVREAAGYLDSARRFLDEEAL